MAQTAYEELAVRLSGIEGVSEDDIKVARRLAEQIEEVDHTLFPEKQLTVGFHDSPFNNTFALYAASPTLEQEAYIVFVPGISDLLTTHTRSFMLFSKVMVQEASPKKRIQMTQGRLCEVGSAGIACHEARHRVQAHNSSLRLVNPDDNIPGGEQSLGLARDFATLWFDIYREDYREGGYSDDYINRETGPDEYDATVIELIVINNIFLGAGFGDVAGLVAP